ncbi:rho guanine nucleotide exchange factor 15 [Chanos chanos]|uniref:Rho guanine nucleotide exchange factor 15 n=1 Tax=Chanos chanos TaxID=29144 RepID=A0A6J2VIY9_CHACN|nr:rho guanine nucleotide exchange factor 15-like [Chanos chanos]
MSATEGTPCPSKPEPKPRPPVPSKRSNGTPELPSTEIDSTTSTAGKVKSIVDKFTLNPPSAGPLANGNSGEERPKKVPIVKPKPRTFHTTGEQAPPLPVKRSQSLRKREEEPTKTVAQGTNAASDVADGSRSAPDGKEVESLMTGRLKAEVEHNVDLSRVSCCVRNCSCICHLQRPGMKLVWVPINQEEENGKEKEGLNGEAEEEEYVEEKGREEQKTEKQQLDEEEDLYKSESSEEEEENEEDNEEKASLSNRPKLPYTLELKREQQRRRSDPGPHAVLNNISSNASQSPTSLSKAHSMEVPEEESIYEDRLEVLSVPTKTQPDKALTIPTITVLKPPRRSKPPSTPSNAASTSPASTDANTEEPPPAIPPRVPIVKGSNLRPGTVPRGGIPLPQPTAEELRALRPSPPLPTQNEPSPPQSPLIPHRPAPDPPCKSSQNGQSLSKHASQSPSAKAVEQDEGEGENTGKSEKKEEPRATLTRTKSIDLDADMEDEPLYQIYCRAVINNEIRRTVCRNISKTSYDYQLSSTDPEISKQLTHNKLWRDLPEVKDSGLLDTLSPEQCKYQESMFEVITSELSYMRSLRVLTDHFLESRDLNETLRVLDKKTLFSCILRIREVSERFLKDLVARLEDDVVMTDICDIIHYHGKHHFPAYIDYVRNQIYQEKCYTKLMQTNTQFAAVISRLQESPMCQRLPFMSFLLLPFQRITRIKMLIENILKRTQEGTKEEKSATKALESVSEIMQECNAQVGKMKQMEELIEINRTLEFDKLRAIPIITQKRFLEKRGELQEVAKGGTIFNLRPKLTPVFLFLFNDLLVIANKKSAERYMVLDYAHRSLVQVQSLPDESSTGSNENCFCLTLLENHQGRSVERVLKAPTQSDMHRWMAAFPGPKDPDKEMDEVIYEDWDCPQVQCVERYVAQQADELNLEPTEIVNVIRKTNEGWYEGIRLSDGQKGWFPVGNVLEITNEHVRRRNLRERYRVIQAASSLTKS